MSAGMYYEAMNNAGLIILSCCHSDDDNDMSIAQPVGALSSYLSTLITSRPISRSKHHQRCESEPFFKYDLNKLRRELIHLPRRL